MLFKTIDCACSELVLRYENFVTGANGLSSQGSQEGTYQNVLLGLFSMFSQSATKLPKLQWHSMDFLPAVLNARTLVMTKRAFQVLEHAIS